MKHSLKSLLIIFPSDLDDRSLMWPDNHDGGPAVDVIRVPIDESLVVKDRVLNIISYDGLLEHKKIFLIVKLGTMATNKGDLLSILEHLF